MPREPKELIREGGFKDAEKFYILSFEGTVSEKRYFKDFRNSDIFNNNGKIETIPLKRPAGRGTDPINVKKLLQEAKKEFISMLIISPHFPLLFFASSLSPFYYLKTHIHYIN